MSPAVFLLVAAAAVLHGTWNALLKTAGDPLRTSTGAVVAGIIVGGPLAAIAWVAIGRPAVPAEAVGLAVVSGLVEVAYFVFLSAAYRRGDLSLVYPIARGTAPLLAVASGVLILGERLGPIGALGVAAMLAGILAVRRPWRALLRPVPDRGVVETGPTAGAVFDRLPGPGAGRSVDPAARRTREAVLFALATGAMIAVYSSIDRVGARLTEPWLYGIMLWVVCGAGLVAWVRVSDARRPPASRLAIGDGALPLQGGWRQAARLAVATDGRGRAIVIGVLLLAAYLLVLVAFTIAPLTAVAPLRESAVILASGWGAIRLREAADRREATFRVGGSVLIVVGAILLATEG